MASARKTAPTAVSERQPGEVRLPGERSTEDSADTLLRQDGRMDLGLRDMVYLVTGGSRGLGFAAAKALVADGAHVVLSARDEASASAAAARLAQ